MKKPFFTICLMIFILIGVTNAQSPFLTFRFADPFIKAGSPDTLVFDIQVKCDVTGTYHSYLSIYLNYNTLAFGQNVATNDNIILERSGLTAVEVAPNSGIYKYNFLPIADNSPSRVAFGTEPAFGVGALSNLTEVPTTFINYVTVKMVISNNSQQAGLSFEANLMNGDQFYVITPPTSQAYGTCVFDNTYISLPLNPNTNLILSEIADPSNSNATFIEVYNAGSTSVDFDGFYAWYLSNNSSSSVRLTGLLAAGGTFVIANNAGDFNSAYPGKSYNQASSVVGTSGSSAYVLSIYGDYDGGTYVDVYDGSETGFNFTGKHAVRRYPVVTPNTTLTGTEWVISSAENKDMTPGSHRATLTWNGGSDDAWRNLANWTEAYIPDVAHNVLIPNLGETLPTVFDGESAYCHSINFGGSGDSMRVTDGKISKIILENLLK